MHQTLNIFFWFRKWSGNRGGERATNFGSGDRNLISLSTLAKKENEEEELYMNQDINHSFPDNFTSEIVGAWKCERREIEKKRKMNHM